MVHLTRFYNKKIYNTEGKYVGKVQEVVLNIKKGRISFFKTKAISEDNKNVGLRDVLRNSMRLIPDGDEEEEQTAAVTEEIVDIPYEIVSAVGDIIIIEQAKLNQYQAAYQKANPMPQKQAKKPLQKPN
ncbi:MAG: PRC-barrel domain-containing protein [Methanosphaera sp.]|uniref:PRC-barrel domain-containing protein n=1 Tax=Methanosphaera sp. TaxID=2666342 RepID=UPI0025F9BF09|nr:PRC-barrel domain-containing protein [Methanosphaera sp.]MCI5867242.1 PRC-barrel domain-containing protein [Methanosphaera sp.]MDD6534690.1 PRC-barrel domain-containing protein [Methanosphaera sp.]MDY3955642.1 PRC-barrel domain-containing protein [Methanosphaera sp.]